MLFHSQVFVLAFLPIVLAAYYALSERTEARQWFLLLASLFFYAWWDVRFLPLIVSQAVVSWLLAKWHFKMQARWPLWLAIAANLAVLGCYKYLDFFITIVADASGIELPKAGLILPIGISFYTFQIVSYLVDALRSSAPKYGLRQFTLFVVVFPQLIAGPIVRHSELIEQFSLRPLRAGWEKRVGQGLALFVGAIAIKVLIADKLAQHVDPIYALSATAVPTFFDACLATFGFAFQIFFDFAAYSEMAIGLALMLGLSLPKNFAQPYRATSLQDFWRRWHMTLSRFLRDYLYIPLGGSRNGASRYLFAVLTTMALCGLWHGAGWNFIYWGIAHGVGLVICRLWTTQDWPMPVALGWLLTFLFVSLMFVVFRTHDIDSALRIFHGLTGAGGMGEMWKTSIAVLLGVSALAAFSPYTLQQIIEHWMRPSKWVAATLAMLAIYVVLEVGKGQPQSFIYFQF